MDHGQRADLFFDVHPFATSARILLWDFPLKEQKKRDLNSKGLKRSVPTKKKSLPDRN
jgi:hypothetical protein